MEFSEAEVEQVRNIHSLPQVFVIKTEQDYFNQKHVLKMLRFYQKLEFLHENIFFSPKKI